MTIMCTSWRVVLIVYWSVGKIGMGQHITDALEHLLHTLPSLQKYSRSYIVLVDSLEVSTPSL